MRWEESKFTLVYKTITKNVISTTLNKNIQNKLRKHKIYIYKYIAIIFHECLHFILAWMYVVASNQKPNQVTNSLSFKIH